MNSASRDTAPWHERYACEARNRKLFVRRIKQKSGIKLEVISAGGGIAARQGSGACRAGTGGSAPLHRGSRRWKPGDQHPAGPHRGAGRAIAVGHRAPDDHAGTSRGDSSGGGGAGAAVRARSAGVEIGAATEFGGEHRGGAWGKRGNAGECRARPAAARLADHGVVALARAPAGHSQARRARGA